MDVNIFTVIDVFIDIVVGVSGPSILSNVILYPDLRIYGL